MNKITLHHISGDFWSYLNLEDAYDSLGYKFISENVGSQFHYTSYVAHFDKARIYKVLTHFYADFIMRDEKGKEITFEDFYFLREIEQEQRSKYFSKREIQRTGYPVPGVHKFSNYKRYRKPKTTNERRSYEVVEYDTEHSYSVVKPRAKRNHKNLPTYWDDVYRNTERSWKSNRKFQWKND